MLATWRKFPTEIAYDLSAVHHRHIGEWHRGEMSSRELIELLEPLSDRSAFKTALRGGDWCDDQYVAARTANEAMLARADGNSYMPNLILSPRQLIAERERLELRQRIYEQGQAEMTGRTRTRKAVS